ncbi:hypothetical protein [Methanocorpusculum vombati]
MNEILDRLDEYDAIVVGSPVYYAMRGLPGRGDGCV